MHRTIDYKITKEHRGFRISTFLKEKGYPERVLTILRKEEGNIRINGKNVHMNYTFNGDEDEILSVIISEAESSEKIVPVYYPLDIVFEDKDILVINKPAGMPIHPSLNNYENTLANAVAYYFAGKNEPFVFRCINRLDRDTTGLTILAKHYLSAGILSQAMQNRLIHREYTAIVEGKFDSHSGTVDLPIGRENSSMITRTIDKEKGERAVTHYRVVDYNSPKNLSVLKLNLETGRTHQIRVHMTAIGHPLVGDFLYNPSSSLLPRQALHAGNISFVHPITGKQLQFETPLPKDMQSLFK